jgi:hypothetical protein
VRAAAPESIDDPQRSSVLRGIWLMRLSALRSLFVGRERIDFAALSWAALGHDVPRECSIAPSVLAYIKRM